VKLANPSLISELSAHYFPQFIMPDQTTASDDYKAEAPLSEDTEQPSEFNEETEPTDTVESLKEKLAAQESATKKAEEEASRWKGRVKEENPPKKKEEKEEDYTEWRIDNRDRIALVKEEYEKELEELQGTGAKISNTMREKALRLAEQSAGVKKAELEEPIPSGEVDRSGSKEPSMTDYDIAYQIKPETKKKYAHLEREW